jgi:predicted Zn-dependent protease
MRPAHFPARVLPAVRRPLRAALLLLSLGAAACATVGMTGRKQLLLLPEGEEQKLGLASYEEILKKEKLSTDPQHNELVQRVGQRIAAATGRSDLAWEFKVIDNSQTINAFCLPGGKVAVYTGILPVTQSEAGLAAVMGHEVAHAIARHGGERVSQQMVAQLGLSAVSAGMSSRDPKTVETVTALLGAGTQVGVLLPFSRKQESEADYMGLIYMAKAGYDPREAVSFWERMSKASGGGKLPEFLSTHPADQTRIAELREKMPEALKHYQGGQPPR